MNQDERDSLRREIDAFEPADNFTALQRQFEDLRKIVEQRNQEIAELKAELARIKDNKTAKPLF